MAMKPLAERITEALHKEPGLLSPTMADLLHVPMVNLMGTLSAMLADGRLKVDGTGEYRRWYVGELRYDPGAPDPDEELNSNTGKPYTYAELASGD